MHCFTHARTVFIAALFALAASVAFSQDKVRVTGTVRDEANAIALPGIPVEVAGGETVYTDVDGRYRVDLAPGDHELKVTMEGYEPKVIRITAGSQRDITVDVAMTLSKFAETVTVTATAIDVPTSSAEAQLVERKQASVITDNVGAQEMKQQRRLATPPRRCRASPACRSSTTSTSSSAASASATATPRWRARCCRRPSRTRRSCRSTCSRPA